MHFIHQVPNPSGCYTLRTRGVQPITTTNFTTVAVDNDTMNKLAGIFDT